MILTAVHAVFSRWGMTIFFAGSVQRAPTCDFLVDTAQIDSSLRCSSVFLKSSHGLTDVFQALLNVINNVHCSLWDPGSWAEDGTHTALVQELIVLQTHRNQMQFI